MGSSSLLKGTHWVTVWRYRELTLAQAWNQVSHFLCETNGLEKGWWGWHCPSGVQMLPLLETSKH